MSSVPYNLSIVSVVHAYNINNKNHKHVMLHTRVFLFENINRYTFYVSLFKFFIFLLDKMFGFCLELFTFD